MILRSDLGRMGLYGQVLVGSQWDYHRQEHGAGADQHVLPDEAALHGLPAGD